MASADYQTQLRFRVNVPTGTSFVDGAAILSAGNHRLYRQFKGYKMRVSINNVGTGTAAQDSAFVVSKLPTSWPMIQALKHGKEQYDKAMAPEAKDRNRWADYRIRMRGLQDVAGVNTLALPKGVSVNTGINYEYTFSTVADSTGNTYTFVAKGASITAGADRYLSALQEYDQTDDTNMDTQGGTSNYHLIDEDVNQVNESIVNNEGDLPPYNSIVLQIPDDEFDLYTMTGAAPGAQQRSTGWMDVPLGLLEVTNAIAESRELVIEFYKGDYKGVMAVDF